MAKKAHAKSTPTANSASTTRPPKTQNNHDPQSNSKIQQKNSQKTNQVAPELYPYGSRGPVGSHYLAAKYGVRWGDLNEDEEDDDDGGH